MSKQPRDEANYPIPLLSYKLGGGQHIAIGSTATLSSPVGSHTRVISLYATTDCYFEVGDATVVADLSTSHFLPTGVYLDISMGSENNPILNAKYVSVISSSSGYLHLSERV